MRTVLAWVLCFGMIGCSDPVPPPGGGVEQPGGSRVLDRGAPLAPGQDVGVDPQRMGPEPIRIETRLQYSETKAGDLNAVGCEVLDLNGEQIIDLSPIVYIEPDRNIQRDVGGLSGTTPGAYSVFCSLPAYNLVDESAASWVIVPGDAVTLQAQVSASTIAAGDVVTIVCEGIDEFGNRTSVDNAEFLVSPEPNNLERLGGGQIRLTASGEYQVGCRVAGLGEAFEVVRVSPGKLSSVQVSLSPNRVAYRVDELIEIQWLAQDEFGNAVEDGISLELDLPAGGQLVGVSRFRLGLSGAFSIGVVVTDGFETIVTSIELRIDDGAPTITCLSPGFGDQVLAAEGEGVVLTAKVDDELAIESVFVGEQEVTPNAEGVFSVTIPAVFGPNVVKITAQDAIGERTSRLCGFSAAGRYLSSQTSVPSALRLHLDDIALDDNDRLPAFGSLGDVVRAFLNSEGLYEAMDDALTGANPLVPEACRIPEVFGRCGFSAGMTYRSLRVQGPNSASFEWVSGGLNGTFSLTSVSASGDMTGWALLVGDYVKALGLETDWIQGDLSIGIQQGATGALRVTNVSVNNLTLGDIRRIDPNPNGGFFDGLVDRFEDGILAVTDYFFRDMIVEYIAETIENESAAYLDDLIASLGTTGVEGVFVLPTLDGGPDLDVAWQTAVDGLEISSGGMLLSASARFTTGVNERRAMMGVPVPGGVPRSYVVGQSGTGAVVDFTLINHVLTVLWEAGYLDIDAPVVEYLGGVDLLGTSFTAQLVAPPSLSGTADGKMKIGVGPLEGRGSIPLIGLGEVVFRASATVEAEVSVQDWQTLTLGEVEVTDLSLALDGVPIGATGTSDFERGVRSLLGTIINNTLTNLLPSIPIPTFVMPAEYGRFGVPGNTRLGLLSGGLDVQARDLELDGTFGEILP